MRNRNDKPENERQKIGTPAGEPAEEGRERHNTEPMHPDAETPEAERRRLVDEEDGITDDELGVEDEEISTTGGITGVKVKGGNPPGGKTSGGTQSPPEEQPY